VRTQTLDDEIARLQDIFSAWRGVQARVADLLRNDAGILDGIRVSNIPLQHKQKLDAFSSD